MNLRVVLRLLGYVAWLIAGTMLFSLPWALPWFGHTPRFESSGALALLVSIGVSLFAGWLLYRCGEPPKGALFRREAMAVVGLSWVLATVLGALPFYVSGTGRGPIVTLLGPGNPPRMNGEPLGAAPLPPQHYAVLEVLVNGPSSGLGEQEIAARSRVLDPGAVIGEMRRADPILSEVLLGEEQNNYRIAWTTMSLVDCLFESQSGFSTTGATVLTRIEDNALVPRCILFWRSSTHFLGGLGIIVLFVAILGQGSAGKALMRNEIPGPSKDSDQTRMQHAAWTFAGIYCALTAVLSVVLWIEGLSVFDALCHAFGTLATGGFSTYDSSVGHFATVPGLNGPLIEYTIIVFMLLAGTNFTLLYFFLVKRQVGRLLADVEWRTYILVILGVTCLVIVFGINADDFASPGATFGEELRAALRYGLFQVVSIMTTTGFGTHDFNSWNSFGRGVLFLLMFVGGCAGSTGGGLKVIRHIMFLKILRLEVERAFHPSVVRPLRIGGEPVEDPDVRRNVVVYFCLILVIFVFSWMALVTIEPDRTWETGGQALDNKLIDAASSVSATLNNIGPGLGIVGATQNYAHFTALSKLLFTVLMMLGRLEIFAVLVLFVPSFWRNH